MKGMIHKFYNDTYGSAYTVTFHRETFCKLAGWDTNDAFDGGVNWNTETDLINIFVPCDSEGGLHIPTIAHEAFHAADNTFERCGIQYATESGNEHMAYLLDWIVRMILDCMQAEYEFIKRDKS